MCTFIYIKNTDAYTNADDVRTYAVVDHPGISIIPLLCSHATIEVLPKSILVYARRENSNIKYAIKL